ncbi:hypothetical protein [Paenibacillus sp. GCM10027626]|uniref:hypothetical protein n=1 Tax=Paenibacillus sp. GCM10027626 TaxID=3273411 RepID=UPI0036321E3E
MNGTIRLNGVLRMYMKFKLFLLFVPWLIVFSSFVVNLIVGYFVTEEVYTGGVISIYVYMLIAGLIVLPQMFPFSVGLSMRRKDFYYGTLVVMAAVSVITAALLVLLSVIEHEWASGWGVGLHFFHLPIWNDAPAIGQFWMMSSLLLHVFMLGFVISSVHRRFGKMGMLILTIVSFLLSSLAVLIATYNHWWETIFSPLLEKTPLEIVSWLFPLTIVYALISYLLLRKSTV